ncbi:MAG: acyl-CoA dehydratase activase [Dehalogenimonas sp.]|uniref:Acyl-CoA dehydratase activase n=1 Tax=Candidatus Dehalogenimonas loeffleri TaxID=3127115 RepID=A0ABZ2J338_9CHLR|nr:acyl-CoA dehydratase activase [Dehalogenimonas sp.]
MGFFLGIDAGSISTKAAVLDDNDNVILTCQIPTGGDPLAAACQLRTTVNHAIGETPEKLAVTGSARELVGTKLGASIIKNEITCQALAAEYFLPGVRTVIEMGGQDSKLIIVSGGLVQDFAMNTVCAAGTGSFLEHQASRLGLSIEAFAEIGNNPQEPVNITGRCTVFAESDMIHAQQSGASTSSIIYGLCLALVRNFLSDTRRINRLVSPIMFQGGVARNQAMVRAFEKTFDQKLHIPDGPEMTGAIGAALIQKRQLAHNIR